MQTLPTLRQLQYLTALSEYQSFSEAARYCHVTQSTLSAGIAALENLLEQSLVDRSRRQVRLTPLGEEVARKGQQILLDAGDIMTRARQLGAPLAGPLRLGIIPTVAPYLLPRLLPKLQKSLPEIELQLTEDLSARLLEGLQKGALDLLLLAFPYETPGMVQKTLFAEDFYLACPRGYWQKKTPVRHADLEGEDLLLLEEGHCLRDHALSACDLRPKPERQAFSTTSLPTLIQMVEHGYGVTLLPAMAVENSRLPDGIETFAFKAPAPQRQIGLAWRANSPREELYQALAETIAA